MIRQGREVQHYAEHSPEVLALHRRIHALAVAAERRFEVQGEERRICIFCQMATADTQSAQHAVGCPLGNVVEAADTLILKIEELE